MVRFAAGMLLGVLPIAWMATLPSWWWAPLCGVGGAALLAARRWLPVAGALLGLAVALGAAQARLAHGLAPALEGRDITLTGTVVGIPEDGGRRTRFRLAVDAAQRDGQSVIVPAVVRLNWYGTERPQIEPGMRWRLGARLERARGFANPGTFDYALWLFREGIGATGYVRDPETARRLADAAGPSLAAGRERLREHLQPLMPTGTGAGILMALALGHRSGIAPADWDILRATGTTHLVAISGLHIGIVALIGFQCGRVVWRLAGPLRRLGPRPIAQAWIGLAAAAAYAALAGFALPTVRALLMLAVALATIVLRRRARPLEGLATAAVAVLLFDPLAPLGASFWLSFGAVAAILYLAAGRVAPIGRAQRWIALQLGITVALTPLLLGFFGQASLVAPIANLVAIPWISLVVVPLTLAGTALATIWPDCGQLLFAAADMALMPLWRFLQACADWPLAEWHGARPTPPILLLALAGVTLVIAPRGVPARGAGVLALLPLLLWHPARPEYGGVRLHLLDVGQGLAAVIRTRDHTLVYDTGARFSNRFDAGSAVVVPFLRARGVHRIDALVLSHLDNDHAGGRDAVLRDMAPATVWTSAPHRLETQSRLCARRWNWTWDGVAFRFLHPDPDDALTGNDASCVLRIDAPGGSLLLPGDIESTAEWRLLARGTELDADVVVAPHHGSLTSSTPAFVRAVDPDHVLYAVGYRNRWDFPRPEVVDRWSPASGLGTDCAGAIHVSITPEAGVSKPRGWRQARPRFWRSGCARVGKSGTMRAVEPGGSTAQSGG
ncbi:DNA internalization-related competence protein ComEC/Rec2 [Halofilum ochraceum]|uniref:DNA internalization-related competence protein ComEC/Rec2 n=1 Tax=Halofilum ochraceum TaxID=1611323 RepID=UPI0008DAD53F|nr:DNA internalization-related competence protein ComEC/Rec2 [Halofilum ochraceum]